MSATASVMPQYLNGKPIPEWLTRKEAAAYLTRLGCAVAPRTLEKWASNKNEGGGPPFTQFRWRIVRYRRVDLDAWVEREAVRIA